MLKANTQDFQMVIMDQTGEFFGPEGRSPVRRFDYLKGFRERLREFGHLSFFSFFANT
jgi:hypothetical protein